VSSGITKAAPATTNYPRRKGRRFHTWAARVLRMKWVLPGGFQGRYAEVFHPAAPQVPPGLCVRVSRRAGMGQLRPEGRTSHTVRQERLSGALAGFEANSDRPAE